MTTMVSVRSTRRDDAWECTVDVDDPRGTTHHTVDVMERNRDRERWAWSDEIVGHPSGGAAGTASSSTRGGGAELWMTTWPRWQAFPNSEPRAAGRA